MGDVVLLKADKKLGPASFRLAKVAAIHPDDDGVVRSVTLSIKSRRKQRVTTVEQVYMAVQRLCVMLPVEEQWQGELVAPE